jgi:hypothetical protein
MPRLFLWRKIPREAAFWLLALALLAWRARAEGISLCPSSMLDLGKCPGCGLGHAIGLALRGAWSESLQTHVLGLPAVLLLLLRTAKLMMVASQPSGASGLTPPTRRNFPE